MRMNMCNSNTELYEFQKIYKEEIQPELVKYEPRRQKELAIIILLGIILFAIVFYTYFISSFLFFVILIVVISSLVAYIQIRSKKFSNILKNEFYPTFFNSICDIKWRNSSEFKSSLISDNQIDNSKLFAAYDKRINDDEFKGRKNGVEYLISETKLLLEGKKKPNIAIPIFKGIIISFKSNKEIKNKTIVSTKGDLTSRNDRFILLFIFLFLSIVDLWADPTDWRTILVCIVTLYLFYWIFTNPEKLNKVTLEDTVFNKRFNVYSEDQVEARYLLTTSFMERLYNLKTTFGARKLKCSFFCDNLMIAIHTRKNLFEPGNLFHSLKDDKLSEKLFKDINSILHLVEYFKLDENTGL